jgi:hypothetical protein
MLSGRVFAVAPLGQAVSLVSVHEQLALPAAAGHGPVDLLGLAQRHPRVVRAVDDEQRGGDVVEAMPTMSTPAARRPGWNASPASTA